MNTDPFTLRAFPMIWHLHLRDGADAGMPYCPITPRIFARCNHYAKSCASVVARCGCRSLRDRILLRSPEDAVFTPFDDALSEPKDTDPDDVPRPIGAPPPQPGGGGVLFSGENFPHWRSSFPCRCNDQLLPAAFANFDNVAPVLERIGEIGLPCAPTRGDRPRNLIFRPRGPCHRPRCWTDPAAATLG